MFLHDLDWLSFTKYLQMKTKDLKTHVSAERERNKAQSEKEQIFLHKSTWELQNTDMFAQPEFAGGFKTGTFFPEHFSWTEASLF